MPSGTKFFLLNRPEDWLESGIPDRLTAEPGGLTLRGVGTGQYDSLSLDTLEKDTIWHRLRMDFDMPGNGQIRLYAYCSDNRDTPPPSGPAGKVPLDLDEWLLSTTPNMRTHFFRQFGQVAREDPKDLTLYCCRGRYFWFHLEISSYEDQDITVRSLKLEFPRVAFIDYLPQVYRGRDSIDSFLARFLSPFQNIYVDLEEDMDRAPIRCDPATAPPEFLRWLADCLSLPGPYLWEEDRLRELLKHAVRLYRIKGTREALTEVLELYTGLTPIIIEQFLPASTEMWRQDRAGMQRLYGANKYTFTVIIPRTGGDPDEYAKIWKVIQAFQPADAICNLAFLEDSLILGRHSYLGMNTTIGASRELVLDGSGASGTPHLGPNRTTGGN